MTNLGLLGVIVYCWHLPEQNRLMVECLDPMVTDLCREGLAQGLWFDRFDTRGPHVLALITRSKPLLERRAEARLESGPEPIRQRLSATLGAYLTANRSASSLDEGELARRHRDCVSKPQCEIDVGPGFADNNTFAIFEHGPRIYPYCPFSFIEDSPSEAAIWSLSCELTSWSIEQLRHGRPTVAAVRWLASLDRALQAAELSPESYWRHHATTLLLRLGERLAASEGEILASLPAIAGERNMTAFSKLWPAEASGTADWDGFRSLVELAVSPRTDRRWILLREIVHCTLKQLGIPVALHVPLVLFAWHTSLSSATAASRIALAYP